MNRIANSLSARDIALDVPVTSRKGLIKHAAQLFENVHQLERNKVFDALFHRELLGSTGLGQSVAIPHAQIKGLKSPLIAVIRAASPVPFESPDAQPVRLFIVLLVPQHASEVHLEILSELAELLSDTSIRKSLLSASDPDGVIRTLSTWQPNHSAG